MKINQKGFSVVGIILVILVIIGLLGTLGWVYLSKIDTIAPSSKQETTQTNQDPCKEGSDNAINGVFCSADIGVSVQVPDIFKGKIETIENYTVYTQNSINEDQKIFRVSDVAFEGTLKGPNDEYSLTIAKEPLRTFRVKSLRPAMFNKDTKQVVYEDGQQAESVVINGIKFYTYGSGDAGVVTNTYLAVIKDKLVVISLDTSQTPGNPATQGYILDTNAYNTLFNQFKDRVKSLKVV